MNLEIWPNLTQFDLKLAFPRVTFRNRTLYHNFRLSPSYFASQMAHKRCVARHSCKIFISWTFLTSHLSRPLLIIRSILICYLLHAFGSTLAKFELAAVVSPVSVADKSKSDDFDLWPDFDLTCDLLRIFEIVQKVIMESFRLPLAQHSPRPPVRELGGGGEGGGQNLPPPSPSGARSAKYLAGRGLITAAVTITAAVVTL